MPNIITSIFDNFGEALSNTLGDRGLDQRWLSKKSGVPEDQISRYTTNKHTPSRSRINLFGEILGVEFVKLQTGEWEVRTKTYVQQAIDSVNQVAEEAIGYKGVRQGRDDVVRQLELAESLIRNSRKLHLKIKYIPVTP